MRRPVLSALVVFPLSLGPTAAASLAPAAAPVTLAAAAAQAAPACADAVVVAVPGAGQGGADNPGATLSALTGRIVSGAGRVGRTATVEVVATSTRGPGALRGRGRLRTPARKAVTRAAWRGWRSGVRQLTSGVGDTVSRAVAACPQQLVYLTGYSQGADAVHRYLVRHGDADLRARTVAVVLVADPARVAGSRGPITGAPRARRSARGVSARFDRRKRTPAVPTTGWSTPVHSVCTAGDVACDLRGTRFRKAARIHKSYHRGTMARRLHRLGNRYGKRLALSPEPATDQHLRATAGLLYRAKLQVDVAAGAAGALRFHARPANLPPGLTLTRGGWLQGTPARAGTWAVDYTVRNRWKAAPSLAVPGRVTVTVAEGTKAVISAGGRHSCEVRPNGTLWCWGANFYGQLGTGDTKSGPTPRRVGTGSDWVDVTAGGMHTCGVRENGTLWCWGLNYRGQLGIGTRKDQRVPQQVRRRGNSWQSAAAGWVHTCAMRRDGSAWCWGDNDHGQLGHGDRKDRLRPARVTGGLQWREVNAGGWHSCGITAGGAAFCWGRNNHGQLGDGTATLRINPARVGGATDWTSIQPAWTHTCGLRAGGAASCWGGNEAGQLGGGPFRGSRTPRPVGGDRSWSAIDAGVTFSCGLDTQQALWCWGTGRQGQLGGTTRSETPVRVHEDVTFGQVDVGWLFGCGIGRSGTAPLCWGNDETGELGRRGTTARRSAARRGGGFRFNLVSFNVLGSNHTSPRKDAGEFSPARVRSEWMVDYLRSINASVVGFQEIQRDQLGWFARAAGDTYDVWPGTSAPRGMRTSIAYRKDVWRMVDNDSVTIPFISQQRDMPLVRLEHRQTGRRIWVMNIHNAPQGHQRQRNIAVRREIRRLKQVVGKRDPVFLVGDFNERDRAFCQVTGKLDFVAPRGGDHDGGCHPPKGFVRIDWIFGSKDVGYSRYREDKSPLVRLMTDHAVLRTRVTVP